MKRSIHLLSLLKNKLRRKPSNASDGSSSSVSINLSISGSYRKSRVGCEQNHAKRVQIMKVFITDEVGPGEKVIICCRDGSQHRADVPPRSQWRFQNCNGEPRPFFLTPVDPAAAAPRAPPSSTEPGRPASVPRERSSANPETGASRPETNPLAATTNGERGWEDDDVGGGTVDGLELVGMARQEEDDLALALAITMSLTER